MTEGKTYKNIELGDSKLLIMGIVLLAIPFYIMFFKADKTAIKHTQGTSGSALQGKGFAFNLVSTNKQSVGSVGGVPAYSRIDPPENVVANELNGIWRKMQAARSSARPYVPNEPPDTALMVEAGSDEAFIEGVTALDVQDLDAAEMAFNLLQKNAKGNDFKSLQAYGGLMEVYMRRNDKESFRRAFKNYALYAQKLRRVYGDMADSVARAYDMFEQIRKVDPGLLREQLTKTNLAMGERVSFQEFMHAIDEAQSWYPNDLTDTQAVKQQDIMASENQNGGKL